MNGSYLINWTSAIQTNGLAITTKRNVNNVSKTYRRNINNKEIILFFKTTIVVYFYNRSLVDKTLFKLLYLRKENIIQNEEGVN